MSIPDLFIPLLNSLKLENTNETDYEGVIFKDTITAIDGDNKYLIPESKVWYKNTIEPNLTALIKRIGIELVKKKHKVNDRIVLSIIGILVNIENKNRLAVLNNLINSIYEVSAYQYQILRQFLFKPDQAIKLNNFNVSAIDFNKIKYLCKKSSSDYFEKYSGDIIGKFGIERCNIKEHIINFSCIDKFAYYYSKPEFRGLILNYFEQLSYYMFNEFRNNFLNEQHLIISMGGIHFEQRTLDLFTKSLITIFQDMKVNGRLTGYVVPHQTSYQIPYIDICKINNTILNDISNKYNLTNYNNIELHQAIKSVSLFISKGIRFLNDNLIDEAFLHFVIALDLLLGDKDSNTVSVSERAAILTYLNQHKSFEEQKGIISNLYKERSEYVHQGISVKTERINEVKSICNDILIALLRLNRDNNNHAIGFTKNWLATLDFIASSIKANIEVDNDIYKKIGAIE